MQPVAIAHDTAPSQTPFPLQVLPKTQQPLPLNPSVARGVGRAQAHRPDAPVITRTPRTSCPRLPHNHSFFTGDIPYPISCIYRSVIRLKLIRFSYAYVLSLCVCGYYFSGKSHDRLEFPHSKARCVSFFHRKEFRRKGNGAIIESLNRFTTSC